MVQPTGKVRAALVQIATVSRDADGRFPTELTVRVAHTDPACEETARIAVRPACLPTLTPEAIRTRFIAELTAALRQRGVPQQRAPMQASLDGLLAAVRDVATDKTKALTKEFYTSAFTQAQDRTVAWAKEAVKQIEAGAGGGSAGATKIVAWSIGSVQKDDSIPFAQRYEAWRLEDGDIAKVVVTAAQAVLVDAAKRSATAWLSDQFDPRRSGVSEEAVELHQRAAVIRSLLDVAERIPGAGTVARVSKVALGTIEFVGGQMIDAAVKEHVIRPLVDNVGRYGEWNVRNFELLHGLQRQLDRLSPCTRPKGEARLALCGADKAALRDWARFTADLVDQWYIAAQVDVSRLVSSPMFRLRRIADEKVSTYDTGPLNWGADRDGKPNRRPYRGIDPWSVQEISGIDPGAGMTVDRVETGAPHARSWDRPTPSCA